MATSNKKTVRQSQKSNIRNSVSHFEDQHPYYSAQATTEKVRISAAITYSPCKFEKENGSPFRENGFDLTFTKNEELQNSIHLLSQSTDKREPLSPSKINHNHNTNVSHSSKNSIVTFSPYKKRFADENCQSISSKSSKSPVKFEKVVKMDPQMMVNPFIKANKNESAKAQIKNLSIYQERLANVPKVSENVEQPSRQRRAKSDRKG